MKTGIKLIVFAALIVVATKLPAQTLQTLLSFNGTNGAYPVAALTLGNDGNFYGTTLGDNNTNSQFRNGLGTVFKMTTDGTLTTLAFFNGTNGANPPQGALVQAPDGNFYGTTQYGGSSNSGTVFRITTNGTLTSLASFTGANGALPVTGLTVGPDGNLYGTTRVGGLTNTVLGYKNGMGTIFKLTTNGVLSTLVFFNTANGASPQATLTLAPDGNFYSTTTDYPYGAQGEGTLFKMTTNGTLTTLATFFTPSYSYPYELTIGRDGLFYGTTYSGGQGQGTIFKLALDQWGSGYTIVNLASFNGANGGYPESGLLLANDGNFYGTTASRGNFNAGTIYQVTTNGTLTSLYSFDKTNGYTPTATLIIGKDGNMYGTASHGGRNGYGTVFRFILSPMIATQISGGKQLVKLSGPLGHDYALQYTTDLTTPNWVTLSSVTNLSANPYQFLDSGAVGQPSRFYRAFIK